jgi:beta-1,4-N-acetylglucosaminyltransferase
MKVAVVCSHGGHLTEMLYISKAFFGNDFFIATYDNPRTRKLKVKTYLFPNFGERWIESIKNALRVVFILREEQPDLIISNGAEIAVPFFYFAKLLKIKTIFIECYTRINEPTITGRLVYPISDLFLVMWPEMLEKYGKKAKYWGNLLEIENYSSKV